MLDFSQVTRQIHHFTTEHVHAQPQRQAARDEANRRLRASGPAWEATREKIVRSRTSWLTAMWQSRPDRAYAPPPRPPLCTVLAADGSQIVADRHDLTPCCLINIGQIALHYGTGERAVLRSRPQLAPPDDDLPDEFQGEIATIAPRRLAVRRLLAECDGLAEMIAETPPDHPTLALFDGTLILWLLETETDAFRAASLTEFQAHLETARTYRTPLVGYISAPQSCDVVNALRIFDCPHEEANCDRHCPHRSKPKPEFKSPDCAGTERVTDADLFARLLQPGERSATFGSSSKILHLLAPEHRIQFFYLHTGREVARVELPAWVAADAELLERTHALCWDQAQKGDGYPVALAEAHEQAIVRGAERDAFFRMMERAFVTSHLHVPVTQKAVSKRARRI